MLVTLGVFITLVLTGNGVASENSTTTSGDSTDPSTNTTTSTESNTTTTVPTNGILLEDLIKGAYSPKTFNGTWVSESEILFKNTDGDVVLYNLDTNSPKVLLDNSSEILQNSSLVLRLRTDRRYLALSFNEVSVFKYSFDARYAVIDLTTGEPTYIAPAGVAASDAMLNNFVLSPDGSGFAFVYANNVYYQSNVTSTPQQLTTTGKDDVVFNGVTDWVYEEEVFNSKNAIWFSSDGSKMAYATFDDRDVRSSPGITFGPIGRLTKDPYKRLRDLRYPKPGTRNPAVTVTIANFATKLNSTFRAPTSQALLKRVRFIGNNRLLIVWTNRLQTSLRFNICYEANYTAAASCSTIFRYNETNGWIGGIPLRFNNQGNSFITILPQMVEGVRYKQIVQITEGSSDLWTSKSRTNTNQTVAELLRWTSDDSIWYKASGMTDRSEQHIYMVNSTGDVSCFTCNIQRSGGGECLYNNAVFSPGSSIVINCDGPSMPQTLMYDTNGTLLSIWENNTRLADLLSSTNVPVILQKTIPMGAGQSDADVILQLPSDYTSRNNMPLLVYVKGGPDTASVTKQWSIDWGSYLVSNFGMAVASIDGRGSSLRGVDNLFAVNGLIGTADIEDQITVTRYLQENLRWFDRSRTCIWGWTYGGYAASMALARGRLAFKCAIAVAPIVDWKLYNTIYTEKFLNTPSNNVDGYTNSSLLTDEVVEAYRNKSYFLIQGSEDDKVDYQHFMLMSGMLQQNDIDFRQMSYTDQNNSLGGVKKHLYHALEKFLAENML